MFKKFLLAVLSAASLFTLTACGSGYSVGPTDPEQEDIELSGSEVFAYAGDNFVVQVEFSPETNLALDGVEFVFLFPFEAAAISGCGLDGPEEDCSITQVWPMGQPELLEWERIDMSALLVRLEGGLGYNPHDLTRQVLLVNFILLVDVHEDELEAFFDEFRAERAEAFTEGGPVEVEMVARPTF